MTILSGLSSFLRSRFLAYAVISTCLAAALVSQVYHERGSFYASAVQLHGSNGGMLILGNFAAFLCISLGLILKTICFGTLRTIEIEHFYDKSWYFVVEVMFALMVFHDDLNPSFVALFTSLYFLRCFHWLSADRIDYMEQVAAPGPTLFFRFRLGFTLIFLVLWDLLITGLLIKIASNLSYADVAYSEAFGGLGMSAFLFATEFALTLVKGLSLCGKFVINLVDQWKSRGRDDAPPWESKSMCVFAVDWVYNLSRVGVYSSFFYMVYHVSGFVSFNHALPFVAAVSSLLGQTRDLLKYRRATRNMDQRYPDATEADIQGMGGDSCIICREDMVPGSGRIPGRVDTTNDTPKKLVCGHVFHFNCLRSWLERQQSCPTCRRSVLETNTNTPPANRNPTPVPENPAHNGENNGNNVATPTAAGTPGQTDTAQNRSSLIHPSLQRYLQQTPPTPPPGAKAPPNGPLGLWPVTFGGVPARPMSSGLPASPTVVNTFAPPSPVLATTPINSQAPHVFRPLASTHLTSNPLEPIVTPNSPLQHPSQSRAGSGEGSQGPSQLAAAAAMRRLHMLSNKQSRESLSSRPASPLSFRAPPPSQDHNVSLELRNTPSSSSTQEAKSLPEAPSQGPRKPYLVPAFPTQPSVAFNYGPKPTRTTPSSSTSSSLPISKKIKDLNKWVTQIKRKSEFEEGNTEERRARLQQLLKLEESIGEMIRESAMAMDFGGGGPGEPKASDAARPTTSSTETAVPLATMAGSGTPSPPIPTEQVDAGPMAVLDHAEETDSDVL